MKVKEIARAANLKLLAGDGEREVTGGVYTCDLLSMVMGRAPAGSAWVTVMCNQNSIVTAMMADVACVVFAEGVKPDEAMLERAGKENIAVLVTDGPVYPAAHLIDKLLLRQLN